MKSAGHFFFFNLIVVLNFKISKKEKKYICSYIFIFKRDKLSFPQKYGIPAAKDYFFSSKQLHILH